MFIDQLEAFLVRLPLLTPFRIADTEIDHCDTIYFRMGSKGLSGWGEVTPGNRPYLTSAWSQGAFLVIKEHLLPLVAEKGFIESGAKLKEMLAPIKGNRHAKAVFDLAWWDLYARTKEQPLWRVLGGKKRPIELGLTFDRADNIESFLQQVRRAGDEKFRRLTFKLRPGWDVQMVSCVRNECPPLQEIQVDIEGALDMESHADILYRLEDFFLSAMEQPLNQNDYVGHTMLAEQLRTPICLDESVKTIEQARIVFDLRAAELLCIKPGRVGGHTEALMIQKEAEAQEIGCYGGCELTSSVGYRHLVALASLSNFTRPCDYLRFSDVFAADPATPLEPFLTAPPQAKPASNAAATDETPLSSTSLPSSTEEITPEESPSMEPSNVSAPPRRPDRGSIQAIELWEEPGLGCEVNREILQKYTIEHVLWQKESC